MNQAILQPEIQEFIKAYKGDTSKLAFSGSPFQEASVQELIIQIEGRKAIKQKLPTWFQSKKIYYPPKVNLEQTSSEITAEYKANLLSGKTIADITGGFGVDSYYFSKRFAQVDYFEQNNALAEIAQHNFERLDVKNVIVVNDSGTKRIIGKQYDAIYVDPSRRSEQKGKVFMLNDCEPNVPNQLDKLFDITPQIMIKTSPMLDLSVGLSELTNIEEIHIIAVNNEVKELLWLLKRGYSGEVRVQTINITKNTTVEFEFEIGNESQPIYGYPDAYLYEPNAAIMKSGAFSMLCELYSIKKLHPNTHLYTSDDLKAFPGRRFKINSVIPYSKKEMKRGITFDKANVATRNFPESVAVLKKRWKIKDGGDIYVFFTTVGKDTKIMLLCEKI